MRRSRGAFSGFLLMLLGLWGALIPFIGPYFSYAYSPDKAWTYNTGRLWLEILPGAAVFLGGFLLMVARGRHTALFGALLAAAAGGWFVLGTLLSPLWNNHVTMGGAPVANTQYMRIMEQLGFYYALGAVIIFIAAVALGRIASVASGLRPVADEPDEPVVEQTAPVRTATAADTVPGPTARTREEPAVREEPVRAEETPMVKTGESRAAEEDTQIIG
ncbi:MAG: hypothetical protein WAK82_26105 [Streptosporangiaceae bacterium]